ncbi:hypothetical protein D5086_033136 [Populus alba]|uniref:Uncharacterized protein n=1 Tax=Populus alba TaxID=43335 RepID=A0ACC4AFY4_POPAL
MRIYFLVRTKKCYKKVNTENLLMMKMKGKSNTELDKTMHISLILYVSLLHVRNAGVIQQISVAELTLSWSIFICPSSVVERFSIALDNSPLFHRTTASLKHLCKHQRSLGCFKGTSKFINSMDDQGGSDLCENLACLLERNNHNFAEK